MKNQHISNIVSSVSSSVSMSNSIRIKNMCDILENKNIDIIYIIINK